MIIRQKSKYAFEVERELGAEEQKGSHWNEEYRDRDRAGALETGQHINHTDEDEDFKF